ncbi:MAG: cytochrome c3 family protein [Arenicella sp.]|nr:cytochrome c3 family protein [Arenicella sp.]
MKNWFKILLLGLTVAAFFYLLSASEVKRLLRMPQADLLNNIPLRKPLPMTFAHSDHGKQQCVSCHHNYQDQSGQGLCIECHLTNAQVAGKLREQFHRLCMGCHFDAKLENADLAAPLRRCSACHINDDRP